MGIFTGLLSVVLVNWSAFNGDPNLEQLRCYLCFVVVFIVLLGFMFTSSSIGINTGGYKVDNMGHLGGAITGLFYGFAFFPRVQSPSGTKYRTAGFILLGLFFSLLIGLFFGGVVVVPNKY